MIKILFSGGDMLNLCTWASRKEKLRIRLQAVVACFIIIMIVLCDCKSMNLDGGSGWCTLQQPCSPLTGMDNRLPMQGMPPGDDTHTNLHMPLLLLIAAQV